MEWFRKQCAKLGLKVENTLAAIFVLIVFGFSFLDTSYFHQHILSGLWLGLAIVWGIIFLAMLIFASFTVLRAVVKASAGFTILIFLAQTYCNLASRTPAGVEALAFVWGAGMLYVLFEFGREFVTACTENLDRIKGQKKHWEAWLLIVLFVFFAFLYMVALYQVLIPIIHSLCIF